MRRVIVLFAFFLLLATACNKNGNSSSSNTINYSLDDSIVTVCQDTVNGGQMIGGPTCSFYTNRQNRNIGVSPSVITIFLDHNCDFTSGPIPYTTSNFTCAIKDNGNDNTLHPETNWIYPDGQPLDPLNVPKGHLTLQLTYRKGGRIKGTVIGNIYGGPDGNPRLAKLNCDFDVVVAVQ
jgi:hypothetical protein